MFTISFLILPHKRGRKVIKDKCLKLKTYVKNKKIFHSFIHASEGYTNHVMIKMLAKWFESCLANQPRVFVVILYCKKAAC